MDTKNLQVAFDMQPGFQYDCKHQDANLFITLRGKNVKSNLPALIFLALFTLTAFPASAEDMRAVLPMDGKAINEIHNGKGKINSVDVKAGKLNITHEPIASLGWEGMTMDFDVQNKAKLAHLKAGQRVMFTLTEIRKGKYVISEITVVK
jgi:Cu(I)/Ag(I) efflux system protein CusF